jgi:DNA-binding response OmpR family regulator
MARILVISDSHNLRISLAGVIEHAGYSVHAAPPGEMPQILNTTLFDLLMLELRTPYQSGLNLLVAIRSLYKLPVIILSSTTYPTVRRRALMHGAAAFLVEPAEPETIVQCVQQTIGRKKSDHRFTLLPQRFSYPNLDISPLQ